MKSKLTIEVDFEDQNTPCIRILATYTDDVRDKILRNFLNTFNGGLGEDSMWCTVHCVGVSTVDSDAHNSYAEWIIKPVRPKDVEEEMTRMKLLVDSTKVNPREYNTTASEPSPVPAIL